MKSQRQYRIELLRNRIKNRNRPTQIMNSILDIFGDSTAAPRPGSYCTFVYYAKTPSLVYDRHPLIAVLGLEDWGFRGFNFHWHKHRNYTWNEVTSVFCPIDGGEISYLKSLDYRVIVKNP
jgi:uncharacterized Fe-S cluster-containing radical SAM superfamily enzyme